MKTKSTQIISIIFLLLVSIIPVSAITATIGNSRMVLYLDENETARRSILVRNTNDVPVAIELIQTGDLADSIVIEEETFSLQQGEEKKAYFTISADKEGTTDSKINVKFIPDDGNAVGLVATIIVVTGNTEAENETDEEENSSNNSTSGNENNSDNSNNEESSDNTNLEDLEDETDSTTSQDTVSVEPENTIPFLPIAATNPESESGIKKETKKTQTNSQPDNKIVSLLGLTTLLLTALLVLTFIHNQKRQKRRVTKKRV